MTYAVAGGANPLLARSSERQYLTQTNEVGKVFNE